ncbi:MAG: hypothetical protein PHQ52_08215, partial [Candidatus Omnitrophica bacterium]|nr:hypothetical protein [Candidatus Omnitrophota bacterium]
TIVNKRKKLLKKLYKKEDSFLPIKREVPLISFFAKKEPFIIGEHKKASPSQGVFKVSKHKDIVKQYYDAGIRNFSVLTEENYFKGSIKDLYEFKKKYPTCAFLRKDFLFCKHDIEISYRAGADAILLIVSILSKKQLRTLIKEARKYRLQTLCEVHDKEELDKLLSCGITPCAIGINCRDLKTFKIDISVPLKLKPYIPKGIKTVFESGIKNPFIAHLAGNAGFDALLIGQGLIENKKRKQLIKDILTELKKGQKEPDNFFTKLFGKKKTRYIKICGMTSRKDATRAVRLGADCLGFIVAPSKRQTQMQDIEKYKSLKVLKIAVVVDPPKRQVAKLKSYISKGYIDAVQFHGNESVKVVEDFKGNAYKVITIGPQCRGHCPQWPFKEAKEYMPVVLFDTPKDLNAKKGSKISSDLFKELKGVWIAGGIDKNNIKGIIKRVNPEFVDICSGIESVPGKKDHKLMEQVIKMVSDQKPETRDQR